MRLLRGIIFLSGVWLLMVTAVVESPAQESRIRGDDRRLPILVEDGRLAGEGKDFYEWLTDNKPDPYQELLNKTKAVQESQQESDTNTDEVGAHQMVQQTGHYVAARRAFRHRYGKIMDHLDRVSGLIDGVFDFSALMIRQNGYEQMIVPPVISKVNQSVKYEEDRVVATEATWRIVRRARLRSNPPDWRQYLRRPLPKHQEINPAKLPRNDKEIQIWKQAIKEGWKNGVKHARRVFREDLNRLKRDYHGMLRFRILAARNMISVPRLDRIKRGIRVRGRQLDVDQRVFKLRMPAEFKRMMDFETLSGSTETEWDQ